MPEVCTKFAFASVIPYPMKLLAKSMTWGTTDAKATKKYLNQAQKYRFQVLQEELVSDAKGFKQVVKNKCIKQHLPNIFAKLEEMNKENVTQGPVKTFEKCKTKKLSVRFGCSGSLHTGRVLIQLSFSVYYLLTSRRCRWLCIIFCLSGILGPMTHFEKR